MNLYDFAKAYQDDLRMQGDMARIYAQFAPSQPAAWDRFLTILGDALISLGKMVKSWRTRSDLGGCAEVSRARV